MENERTILTILYPIIFWHENDSVSWGQMQQKYLMLLLGNQVQKRNATILSTFFPSSSRITLSFIVIANFSQLCRIYSREMELIKFTLHFDWHQMNLQLKVFAAVIYFRFNFRWHRALPFQLIKKTTTTTKNNSIGMIRSFLCMKSVIPYLLHDYIENLHATLK